MKKTFGDKSMGEGASYSWESNNSNVGKGSITVDKAIPGEMVETTLSFDGQGTAKGGYQIQKTDNGCRVTWSLDMDMGSNPFKRLIGSMAESMMGPVFDQGLRSLDSSAAANPVMAPEMPADSMMMHADSTASMN